MKSRESIFNFGKIFYHAKHTVKFIVQIAPLFLNFLLDLINEFL